MDSMVTDEQAYLTDLKQDLVQQFGLYFNAIDWITGDVAVLTADNGSSSPLTVINIMSRGYDQPIDHGCHIGESEHGRDGAKR